MPENTPKPPKSKASPTKAKLTKSPGYPHPKRSTAAEFALRVHEVKGWIAQHMDGYEIVEKGKNRWGVSRQSIQHYIDTARRELIESIQGEHQERMVAEMAARYREIWIKAMAGKEGPDGRLALQADAQLAKLLGLNASDRIAAALAQAGVTQPLTADAVTQALLSALKSDE